MPTSLSGLLRRHVIAVTGEFGEAKSATNIERWIASNGGRVARTMGEDVTHLICSRAEWDRRKKNKMVKQAGLCANVKIVTFDWLEDTLLRRAGRIKGYLWSEIDKSERDAKRARLKRERAKEDAEKSFVTGCKAAERELCNASYHVYRDAEDYFEYAITLRRVDVDTQRKEIYSINIYESHAKPHLYAATISWAQLGRPKTTQVITPPGSYYDEAFRNFRKHFKMKTGIDWNQRCDEAAAKRAAKSREDLYSYQPPKLGRPRGAFEADDAGVKQEPVKMATF